MTGQTWYQRPCILELRLPGPSSPALKPLFQSLLASLTNIDFEFERERDKLSASLDGLHERERALRRLEQRHRERRTPYLEKLVKLEDRIRSGWH